MKVLIGLLATVFVLLQLKLWAGSGGVRDVWRLKSAVAAQQMENAALVERNNALQADVIDLKQGYTAIEERARAELGMIKKDEIFYQAVAHE